MFLSANLKERYYIFYVPVLSKDIIRYWVADSLDATWSDEVTLVIDSNVEPTGYAGTLGRFGVARQFNHLVVIWLSDFLTNDNDASILVSVYE